MFVVGCPFEGWWATPAARRGEQLAQATGHARGNAMRVYRGLPGPA